MEKKNTEDKKAMIDFYYGYIYALMEVYSHTDDPATREGILTLLLEALKDFEIEVRKAARGREAPEGSDLGN